MKTNRERWAFLLAMVIGSMMLVARGASQAGEGEWTTDYAAALQRAQKENKVVLLDFTGSDWCPACMQLSKEVFGSPEFAAWAGKKAVLVEVDFPHDKPQTAPERKQNKELAQKFGIDAFPTIILVDGNGKEIARTVGYDGSKAGEWTKARDSEIGKAKQK